MILRAEQTRAEAPRASERGAAMVEFAGIIFVVAVMMTGVMGRMDTAPIAEKVWWGICKAFSAAPGMQDLQCDDPASGTDDPSGGPGETGPDRAEELGIPCVTEQTNREDSLEAAGVVVRAGVGASDELALNPDGTATVTLGQSAEVGVGNGNEVPGVAEYDLKATVGGGLKYLYEFPDEASAREFLDDRRDLTGRVLDIAIMGHQTMNEAATKLGNAAQEGFWDHLPGVSDAERAQHAQDRANNTADAVGIEIVGEIAASAGAGSNQSGAELEASARVSGEAQVYVDPTRGSSFTGTIEGEIDLGLKAGSGAVAGFVSAGGGLKGSYQVDFDASGEPTKLTVTGELSSSAGLGPTVQFDEVASGDAVGSVGTVVQTSLTLDLSDPANRAAFDRTFNVVSVCVGDYTGAVALPRVPTVVDPLGGGVADWQALIQRIADDSYEVSRTYRLEEAESELDLEVKIGGVGGEVSSSETRRVLVEATGKDNRTGGVEVPMVTCE